MLLRNYDNILTSRQLITNKILCGDTSKPWDDGNLALKDQNGTLLQIQQVPEAENLPFAKFFESASSFVAISGDASGSSSLVCGTGKIEDTGELVPVTYDDYKLARVFTNDEVSRIVANKYIVPTYNPDTQMWSSTYTTTILAKKDLQIGEIGVYFGKEAGRYSDSANKCYVYRELLPEIVAVPANSNFTLTFTVEVPSNPNKPANYSASAQVVTE